MKHLRKAPILMLGVVAACVAALAPNVGAAGQRAATSPSPASSLTKFSVIASGLNNPRGITWAHGHLYITEAGRGGSDCPAGAKGPGGGQLCVGPTGSLDMVSSGVVHHLRTGLPSVSDPSGLGATGIADVTGTKNGLLVLFSGAVVPSFTMLPPGAHYTPADSALIRHEIGMLFSTSSFGGHAKNRADVGDQDFTWTAVHQNLVPDQFPDANPNAVVQVGGVTYIADAASNTLDSVDRFGVVRQLAFFPNVGMSDAVPTCIAPGLDGKNLYIGQLAAGAVHNGGVIFRYHIANGHVSVWKTGFNVVDGCGFDKSGNFYAVELQANGTFNPGPTGDPAGAIIQVAKNGKRTVIGAGKLFFPQGFATDPQGRIYVSNWSLLTSTPAFGGHTGEVVRFSH